MAWAPSIDWRVIWQIDVETASLIHLVRSEWNIEANEPGRQAQNGRGITALLRRMHDAVARDVSAQARLDLLTKIIAEHVKSDVCSIYLRRPDDILELYSTQGLNREAVHSTTLGWGEGLVGLVAKSHRPLVTHDAPHHPAFAYRPETGEDKLHSFLACR